jgi:TPR repeat protein
MSSPTDRVINQGDPLAYAPKWARDATIAEQRNTAPRHYVSKRDEDVLFASDTAEARSTDDASATDWSPARRSLDPIILPPPPSRSPVRFRIAIASGLAVSAAAAALGALLMMEKLPSVAKDDSPEAASFDARFIVDITAGPTNEEALLGQALRGKTADHVAATRTTVGASPTQPANQEALLGEALRGTTADDVASTASPTSRALDPSEIAVLLKRGQELMSSGDIAAARVLLLRAAEAGDPKAAVALAATFDPIMLKKSGVYGVVADISAARSWYEKAKEFGSEEAPRRLEMLAGREM